jgi:glucose-6-phosphate 1-epimerase
MTEKTGLIQQTDHGGQPALALQTAQGARCVVSLFGAQVLSWVPAGGAERLYLSPNAVFDGHTALRGGIPVIFPQFAARGDGPRHGFARTRTVAGHGTARHRGFRDRNAAADEQRIHAGALAARLFAGTYRDAQGNRLDLELTADNTGDSPFEFAAALHSYLRVGEVENCRIEGLRGKRYIDATKGDQIVQERFDAVVVEDEVDRIYCAAPDSIVLIEPGRALGLQSDGFPDLVVWNPWEHKAVPFPICPTGTSGT